MDTLSETALSILNAFLMLSSERGIEATTARVVALAAGVNEATIFRLFKNKATLKRPMQVIWLPFARSLSAINPLSIDM